MINPISIKFGTPDFGWLPVNFRYNDFNLDFNASDVLNDPVEELREAVDKLPPYETKRITWWLEAPAYFFDIERKAEHISLKISKTKDLMHDSGEELLLTIVGSEIEILDPFRVELKHFFSRTYGRHWSYNEDDEPDEAQEPLR